MHQTVANYYLNQSEENFERTHAERLAFAADFFELNKYHGKIIADFGCGRGLLFKRMPQDNKFHGFDGARWENPWFDYYPTDLNIPFADGYRMRCDVGVCCEVLEHLENPYNCLVEIKKLVKENAEILISIPHVTMLHPCLYPALFYGGFDEFLEQMALPFSKKGISTGLPAVHYVCRNAPWTEAKHKFPKSEAKFHGKTPLEYANL